MHRLRLGILASTAIALILSAPAQAAPASPETPAAATPDTQPLAPPIMPVPAERDYAVPGSMAKPSALMPSDDGLRFRGTLPGDAVGAAPRHERAPNTAPTEAKKPSEPAPTVERTQSSHPANASTDANAGAAPKPPVPVATPSPLPPPPRLRPAIAAPVAPPSAQPVPVARPAVASPSSPPAPPPAAVTRTEPKPAAIKPAPAPAAVAQPAAPATDAAAVADKLRELIAGKKFEHLVPRKADRDAIVALYGKRLAFHPLWVGAGGPSERAKDVIDFLGRVDADGLDPHDYPVPNFSSGGAQAQAEAELKMTATVLTYARHALNGRVHFTRISPNIEYKLSFDPDDVLKKIEASNDLGKTLDGFNPQHPAYRALKAKLAELREQPEDASEPRFAHGPVLRYARDRRGRESIMADARVPKLRARLGVAAEPNTNYDRSLANAVAKFQKANGLQPTGQLNNATVDALNGPSRAKKIDSIVATMERWRWIPRDLGRTHVVLNIPDYNLRVYHDGEKVWQTRVVVGKPTNQTPLLSETMKYITVNPTWNVPQSIIYNELLPIYETTDRQIFERQGLKLERNPDGTVRVYQPPGERNALGQIRFNFPNKFLVYQHDTPERHYFAQEKRAYSHGCMRVQDPLKYAEVLLSYASPKSGLTAARIRGMFGGAEQQIDFHTQIPVHITYQTAFVDEDGKLQFRDDIYGHDAALLALMRGRERAVADTAIERPPDPNFKPTPEATQRLRSVARGANPFGLFEQLFR